MEIRLRPGTGFVLGLLLGLVICAVILGLANSPLDRERIAAFAHKLQVQRLKSRISELEKQVQDLENAREKKP
jgi:hypothetical protein